MAVDKGMFAEYEKCLQDEPAATTARCPVHVDVPSFCAAMAAGDFKSAYAELAKRVPFADAICLVCDHPCEDACVLSGISGGEAVRIGELEHAAVRYGYAPAKRKFKTSKKNGAVAVVGGGISGLCAAFDLDRRGFAVTLFEQAKRLGGSLWAFVDEPDGADTEAAACHGAPGRAVAAGPPLEHDHISGHRDGSSVPLDSAAGTIPGQCGNAARISPADIERSLAALEGMAVEVRLGVCVDSNSLAGLLDEYAAVFLGTGDWPVPLSADKLTLQTSAPKLFVGGKLAGTGASVIEAAASGKRAAASMERYIKGVSLTAEREREGAYQTLLAYDITGIAASAAHDSSKPYDEEQAMAEAARCLRCECDACLKGCAHMQRYGRRPKTYAREIYTNENVFLGTRYANTMINSCTLCGLCGQRCPLNLSMAPLVAQTRRSMVASEKMPPSAHDFALRDMAQANSERASLLVAPAGRENGENYVFFPGCQLAATAPEHVEAAYAYLVEHLGAGVGLMLGCCGAPADWAGRDDLLAEGAKAIADAWEQCGRPTFILACSSCKDVLARKLPQLQAVTLWQAIAQHGLPAAASMADGALLNIHDACTARRDALTHESVRSLVASLGFRTEELRYSRQDAKCCGFGGLVYYANREQEADFAADGAAEAQRDLLVYCAMCKGMFTEKGKRCFHLLDLLFAADPEPYALRQAPTLSERQDNRVALRQRFAERLLGLPALAAPPSSALPGYSLEISPEAQAKMEARLILVEDVVDAIKLALEDPGICFSNPARGTRLASVRKQFVTYWVEFKVDATIIIVVSVYSHRMEVIAQAPQ